VLDANGDQLAHMTGGRLWSSSGTEVACVISTLRARVVSMAPDADRALRRVALVLGAIRLPVARGLTGIARTPWKPLADTGTRRRIIGVGVVAAVALFAGFAVAVSGGHRVSSRSPLVSFPAASAGVPTVPPVPPCESGCQAAKRLLVPIPGFEYRHFLPALNGDVSGFSVTLLGSGLRGSPYGTGAFLYVDQIHPSSGLLCNVAGVTLTGSRLLAGVTLYTGLTTDHNSSYCFGLGSFRIIIWGDTPTTIEDFITLFVQANHVS
jgi:hypothetical protein